ncbi:DUF916 and DUF3324 domain-containing protein [Lacticaseibacillus baoqingensis]|uniref:DUF916 and DUF3324 domain-containing protein n=1 Tax=Lacticaseibacillus baoqingensis TaxID=2486013 RepID=A0ABW4EA80_9LACO|nr:DUF916 and DUF3324 domain-containing protein [Lacticaseibacillus baoqingensis]
MKSKKWFWLLPMFVFALWCGTTHPVFASEFDFAVDPQFPQQQAGQNRSYYDLWMKPASQQELTMTLSNDTAKDVKVNVAITNATTNNAGVVEYSPNKIKPDKSLQYHLADLVTYQKQVTIPKKSKLAYHVLVKMPTAEFNGQVAGGITFQQQDAGQAKKKSSGVAINNHYAFVLGLIVHNNNEPTTPKLHLHQVKAGQSNARNVITANLQNSTPIFINQVKTNAVITKQGDSKPVYKHSAVQLQIAPNSNFDYTIPLNGKRFAAGTYHLKLTVLANKSADGKYHDGTDTKGDPINFINRWQFEKDFKITAQAARKYNQTDVSIPKEKSNHLLIIGLIILIVVLLLVILLMWLRSRKHKQIRQAR